MICLATPLSSLSGALSLFRRQWFQSRSGALTLLFRLRAPTVINGRPYRHRIVFPRASGPGIEYATWSQRPVHSLVSLGVRYPSEPHRSLSNTGPIPLGLLLRALWLAWKVFFLFRTIHHIPGPSPCLERVSSGIGWSWDWNWAPTWRRSDAQWGETCGQRWPCCSRQRQGCPAALSRGPLYSP